MLEYSDLMDKAIEIKRLLRCQGTTICFEESAFDAVTWTCYFNADKTIKLKLFGLVELAIISYGINQTVIDMGNQDYLENIYKQVLTALIWGSSQPSKNILQFKRKTST